MKLFSSFAALATVLVLSACAETPTPAPAAAAQPVARHEPQTMTGSRIPAPRTEKMVSATTGQDYQENANSKRQPLIVN